MLNYELYHAKGVKYALVGAEIAAFAPFKCAVNSNGNVSLLLEDIFKYCGLSLKRLDLLKEKS